MALNNGKIASVLEKHVLFKLSTANSRSISMQVRKINAVSIAAIIGLAGFAQPAFAYLDPSTGSMILSAILGILATVGLALKTYWYKFKALFRARPSEPPAEIRPDGSAADTGNNSGG
jgi:hypothetical protein